MKTPPFSLSFFLSYYVVELTIRKQKTINEIMAKPKLDLQAWIELSEKMETNDTQVKTEAMTSLTENLIKILMPNITDDQLSNMTSAVADEYMSDGQWGGWNSTYLFLNDTNSTRDFGDFGGRGGKSLNHLNLSSLFNMSDIGDDLGDLNVDTQSILDLLGLGKPRTHSTWMHTAVALIMVTFVYYVPRMIYYRITRFSDDRKTPGYIPIVFLSTIAILGCLFHLLSFQSSVASEPMIAIITAVSVNKTTQYLYKCFAAAINRLVSPIVVCVCLQQLAAYTNSYFEFFNNNIAQAVYCSILTGAVFGYTFLSELEVYNDYVNSKFTDYPDPVNMNYFETIFPFITAVLFYFAKNKVSRKSVYTAEKIGPDEPTLLDRVSKVVVYQALMSSVAIGARLGRPEADVVESWYTFLICAQTPVVHWVLFRSLLRTRKSNRLCFLMCCGGEEKVGSTEQGGVELNQHPRTNEPSQKNEQEEEEEEEKTEETLDHNKIVVVRESQFEKDEGNRMIADGNQQ